MLQASQVSASGTCIGCLVVGISFVLHVSSQVQLKSMLALAGILVLVFVQLTDSIIHFSIDPIIT